jgi:L-lactate dehydrogenase complex protein LldF
MTIGLFIPSPYEGRDRPPQAADEGHPHRPDPEWRTALTHVVDPEKRAARFIALEVHESTHDRLVWGMRQNRDKSVAAVPEWEELRELASQIKEHTLTHLDHYLEEFEANATMLGTQVHWARDANEHNAVVYEVLTVLLLAPRASTGGSG